MGTGGRTATAKGGGTIGVERGNEGVAGQFKRKQGAVGGTGEGTELLQGTD